MRPAVGLGKPFRGGGSRFPFHEARPFRCGTRWCRLVGFGHPRRRTRESLNLLFVVSCELRTCSFSKNRARHKLPYVLNSTRLIPWSGLRRVPVGTRRLEVFFRLHAGWTPPCGSRTPSVCKTSRRSPCPGGEPPRRLPFAIRACRPARSSAPQPPGPRGSTSSSPL